MSGLLETSVDSSPTAVVKGGVLDTGATSATLGSSTSLLDRFLDTPAILCRSCVSSVLTTAFVVVCDPQLLAPAKMLSIENTDGARLKLDDDIATNGNQIHEFKSKYSKWVFLN